MKKIILLLSLLTIIPSCSSKKEDLKSPCVSTDEGPCGPRRAVNKWLS